MATVRNMRLAIVMFVSFLVACAGAVVIHPGPHCAAIGYHYEPGFNPSADGSAYLCEDEVDRPLLQRCEYEGQRRWFCRDSVWLDFDMGDCPSGQKEVAGPAYTSEIWKSMEGWIPPPCSKAKTDWELDGFKGPLVCCTP